MTSCVISRHRRSDRSKGTNGNEKVRRKTMAAGFLIVNKHGSLLGFSSAWTILLLFHGDCSFRVLERAVIKEFVRNAREDNKERWTGNDRATVVTLSLWISLFFLFLPSSLHFFSLNRKERIDFVWFFARRERKLRVSRGEKSMKSLKHKEGLG